MTALSRLSGLLGNSLEVGNRSFPVVDDLDPIVTSLRRFNSASSKGGLPEDLQLVAVQKFWESQKLETLKDARLVSFGICLPNGSSGLCIMEDRQRFLAVLDSKDGVEQWVGEPLRFRRCYQGLVRSYFTYDAKADSAPAVGKKNWVDLRDYLSERLPRVLDRKSNPDWVPIATDNSCLFGEDPCEAYAEGMLAGDTSRIDQIRDQLGVEKSSWFWRELVLAQVQHATMLQDQRFTGLLPVLLELLSRNQVLRDRGLILLLDRYSKSSHLGINELLRNAAVDWWGNPWLPSNDMRWGGLVPAAREMVSEWLKREFIEAFFTKLAEDGVGDSRRANFWLRYVKAMDNIQFALGKRALSSRDRDFAALRKKMEGLYTELRLTSSENNAFIMTLGNLVAVEFGDGGAFYGYDKSGNFPFDVSRPVVAAVDYPNSLKRSDRMLWMKHQDGIHGWDRWEEMFEATLKESFNILPNATTKIPVLRKKPVSRGEPVRPYEATQSALELTEVRAIGKASPISTSLEAGFTKADLYKFAEDHRLVVEDLTGRNGNLWVRANESNQQVCRVLINWGFAYKAGKGWWR